MQKTTPPGILEILFFIRKVWDCPQYMVIGSLGGVSHINFERNDGI